MSPSGNPLLSPVAQSRRAFLVRASAVGAGVMALSARASAQGGDGQPMQSVAGGVEMTSDSYKPVVRPAKPKATPTMDKKQLETFERQLACPCPCTLDIYTCRTTDFTCSISPAVHGDIQRLVDGGYTADEIMEAMTGTYGDFILMTPRKQGFNLLAWFAPFAALVLGAVGVGALLRSWRLNARDAAARAERLPMTVAGAGVEATPEELARLEAALRQER